MRYLGGKTKLSRHITKVMLDSTDSREKYIEPFVGGGSVLTSMAHHFAHTEASDTHEDLILLWKGLQDGSFDPPSELTDEEYQELKASPPSALRGFVGFGCSFGGKFFGGRSRGGGRNHVDESRRNVLKQIPLIEGVNFVQQSYEAVEVHSGDVIYCDPPYEKTTKYAGTETFDHKKFWEVVQNWAEQGAHVFVSELAAPEGWECVWQQERSISVDKWKPTETLVEKLFTFVR